MSEQPKNIVVKGGPGGKIAIINGKTYTLLRGYEFSSLDGWFWLAVAGKTPLKAEDLADKWLVTRAGNVYIACMARPFSYFLLGDNPVPDNDRWPRFKTPAPAYAFVGPTEEAAIEQLRLALSRYRPTCSVDRVLERAYWAIDRAGGQVRALLVLKRFLD